MSLHSPAGRGIFRPNSHDRRERVRIYRPEPKQRIWRLHGPTARRSAHEVARDCICFMLCRRGSGAKRPEKLRQIILLPCPVRLSRVRAGADHAALFRCRRSLLSAEVSVLLPILGICCGPVLGPHRYSAPYPRVHPARPSQICDTPERDYRQRKNGLFRAERAEEG